MTFITPGLSNPRPAGRMRPNKKSYTYKLYEIATKNTINYKYNLNMLLTF
jgi:hypothetical protein